MVNVHQECLMQWINKDPYRNGKCSVCLDCFRLPKSLYLTLSKFCALQLLKLFGFYLIIIGVVFAFNMLLNEGHAAATKPLMRDITVVNIYMLLLGSNKNYFPFFRWDHDTATFLIASFAVTCLSMSILLLPDCICIGLATLTSAFLLEQHYHKYRR